MTATGHPGPDDVADGHLGRGLGTRQRNHRTLRPRLGRLPLAHHPALSGVLDKERRSRADPGGDSPWTCAGPAKGPGAVAPGQASITPVGAGKGAANDSLPGRKRVVRTPGITGQG
jgi:hypothetical protein